MLLHVVVPLALGTLVYVLFRDKDIRLARWLGGGVSSDAAASQAGRGPIATFLIGSLPDLAWGWAFGAALMLMWSQKSVREALPWMMGGLLVALASEVGQALGVVPGTFDVVDLGAIAIGFVLGSLLARRASEA